MQFIQNTILGFFDSSQKSYEIPVYQRAYSWEEANWKTFLDDLLEQINGDNNYFFGNLLLEVIDKNKKYEIIDGQQRITTLSIFFRSLLNTLSKRKNEVELADFSSTNKEIIFLKNGGNIKLRPIQYDRACYDALIIDNDANFETCSSSQKRIKSAKKYFEEALDKLDTKTILSILNKIESTEVTVIELPGKKDAALMFELQNNRGKDLTNMEKLKSYFMYQMYVHSPSAEAETNIENISNIFKQVYLTINDIEKLSEDSILIYHNNAYVNGYAYRTLDDLRIYLRKSTNKVKSITDYSKELLVTFSNLKKFETSKAYFATRLFELDIPAYIYPFIIKGYKYIIEDETRLNNLFKVLEILAFRTKLINSRANIQERLNSILLDFSGDELKLALDINKKLNDSGYWSQEDAKNVINGSMYGSNVLNYLLWTYENSIQNKGYGISDFSISNEQIEHISPKKPTNGEPVETGYEVDDKNLYSEEFILKKLHCLGNLILIAGSHNASVGNIPFKKKLLTYNDNPHLKQMAEIKNFSRGDAENPVWKEESIRNRQQVLVDFAIKTWSFSG